MKSILINSIKKIIPNRLLRNIQSYHANGRFFPISKHQGYCPCCRSNTTFLIYDSWLRDNYRCLKCYSKPRQRHVQYVLDTYFQNWEQKKIHESSPSNKYISQYCKDYSSSQLLADVSLGEYKNGVRCENLESLTFDDNTFDIFITQEVFEHVFNPNIAAKEIMRVLKPGGVHVFTAPKHKNIAKSYPRALLGLDGVIHIKPEEYHGNPVGSGRALVTWDYGDDFQELLAEWTKCDVKTDSKVDLKYGLDGEFLDVFIVTKPY